MNDNMKNIEYFKLAPCQRYLPIQYFISQQKKILINIEAERGQAIIKDNEIIEFPWNDDSNLQSAYKQKNYILTDTNSKSRRIMIFFSGNGLYYPNTKSVFYNKIQQNNYYEWINVAQAPQIRQYYEKIIFIRDVFKQWYVTGINEKINTIDKLVEFLRALTDGYEITTCGNSAGGYMACLIGNFLKAKRMYDFSGQFVLYEELEGSPLLKANINNDRAKYYSLLDYIKYPQNVYYFYPANCFNDIKQYRFIANKNINIFAFDRETHGTTVNGNIYPYLLTASDKKIKNMVLKYRNKVINADEFSTNFI